MRKAFKPLTAIVAVSLAAGLLTACHHRYGGHDDPERMAEKLEKHLDYVLDKVEATPQQKDNIRLISSQIVADAKQLRSKGGEDHGKIVTCLLLDAPDRQWLHGQVDQSSKELNEFAHRTVERLIEISAILTPEQREELKKRFETAHGKKA